MELSQKAIEFAEACRDGDIIEGTPVQLEMLARNAQALIDEFGVELDYLRWFHDNVDFGPAQTEVMQNCQKHYQIRTGKDVPANWIYE